MRKSGELLTKHGRITIEPNVIKTYAGSVAVESFGIVGMSAVDIKDEVIKLLKNDHISHGINLAIDEENGLYLDFHIIISYGVSIASVISNLKESVKYKLEAYTGMIVKSIEVYIEGIRVID